MYERPPLLVADIRTTNAVANTPNTTTIVAAPGIGFAIRLVTLALRPWHMNNAAAQGQGLFLEGAAGIFHFPWVGSTGGGMLDLPEPGYQLQVNTRLGLQDISSAASQSMFFSVLYYVDSVT